MSTMSCAELGNVASELALDLLYGEERAAALAHLDTCGACRREVALLTDAADEIRRLVPEVEPPPGFEAQVVARVAAEAAQAADHEAGPGPPTPLARRRHRERLRRLLAVAAAAAVVVLVGASVLVLGGRQDQDTAAARTATMRTANGQVVGDATLSTDPATIVVAVPDWASLVNRYGGAVDDTYWLAVEDGEGTRALERLPPADEHPWTVELDAAPTTVTAVSIVDNGGTVWCTARF